MEANWNLCILWLASLVYYYLYINFDMNEGTNKQLNCLGNTNELIRSTHSLLFNNNGAPLVLKTSWTDFTNETDLIMAWSRAQCAWVVRRFNIADSTFQIPTRLQRVIEVKNSALNRTMYSHLNRSQETSQESWLYSTVEEFCSSIT